MYGQGCGNGVDGRASSPSRRGGLPRREEPRVKRTAEALRSLYQAIEARVVTRLQLLSGTWKVVAHASLDPPAPGDDHLRPPGPSRMSTRLCTSDQLGLVGVRHDAIDIRLHIGNPREPG